MIKYNIPNWRPISGLRARGERKYWGWSLCSSCGMAYQGEQFKAAILNYLSSVCHWPFSVLISLWLLLWLTLFIHSIKSHRSKRLPLSTFHSFLYISNISTMLACSVVFLCCPFSGIQSMLIIYVTEWENSRVVSVKFHLKYERWLI